MRTGAVNVTLMKEKIFAFHFSGSKEVTMAEGVLYLKNGFKFYGKS